MKYIHMLPFLDEEDLDELVEKILNGEAKGIRIVTLYPFLSRTSLDKLVDKLIKEGKSKELNGALPFMSKEKINEIYDAVKEGKLEGIDEMFLMPFLGKNKIKEMFNDLVKKASESGEDFDEEE